MNNETRWAFIYEVSFELKRLYGDFLFVLFSLDFFVSGLELVYGHSRAFSLFSLYMETFLHIVYEVFLLMQLAHGDFLSMQSGWAFSSS